MSLTLSKNRAAVLGIKLRSRRDPREPRTAKCPTIATAAISAISDANSSQGATKQCRRADNSADFRNRSSGKAGFYFWKNKLRDGSSSSQGGGFSDAVAADVSEDEFRRILQTRRLTLQCGSIKKTQRQAKMGRHLQYRRFIVPRIDRSFPSAVQRKKNRQNRGD